MPDPIEGAGSGPSDVGAEPDAALVAGRRLLVGSRVVVRHRLPEGAGARFTDVVGTLTAADEQTLTIESRRGPITVARRDIVAAKSVPPAPRVRGSGGGNSAPH